MAKELGWNLNHTLNSKKYFLNEWGLVATATLKNTGKGKLHIYDFGIEFEWQKEADVWWSEKCDIFLNPEETTELPTVGFVTPIGLKPGIYKYKLGVRTESLPDIDFFAEGWQDHGLVFGNKEHNIEIIRHPSRNYQVFVSHSNHTNDKEMLKSLKILLYNNRIKCFIAEELPDYGEILWKKIRRGICTADKVIFLWTKHAAKSDDVREELGITLGARKRFIPIIEKNVKSKGSLIGTEYIRLNREKYSNIFVKLTEELIKFSEEKSKRKKKPRREIETPF